MKCSELERVLDAYLGGGLEAARRRAVKRHLRGCEACADLVEVGRIAFVPADPAAAEPPEDLVASVLSRTSGSSCATAERRLPAWVDRRLDAEERRLVEAHLHDCGTCRTLGAVLRTLIDDLPLLAEIRPDPAFVDSVLAATLPLRVRLRRWWHRGWQRWVRRPRFAAEAAYATTLALVLIFSIPGSPLQAMPEQAVELARRSAPSSTFSDPWGRLEAAVAPRMNALKNAEGTRAIVGTWRSTLDLGSRTASRSVELGGQVYDWASEKFRTFRDGLASVLEKADDTDSSADQD